MPQDSVFIRHEGAVATIHLNRPAQKNALTGEMWLLLLKAIERVENDTAVKVIVITGEGEAFSVGADLTQVEGIRSEPTTADVAADFLYESQNRLARASKPTIAKVRGPCLGVGCAIALCCDLRFADWSAEFAIAPARIGIAYTLADTKRLMDIVGPAHAKDMLFSARSISADEAYAFGLVNRLALTTQLDSAVQEYAEQIATMSQYSVRAIKRIIQMIADGTTEETKDSRRLYVDAFSGADFKEGLAALVEKRKPNFPVS